jgi:hypothetical protein
MKVKSRIRFILFTLLVNLLVTPDFAHSASCTGATTSTDGNFTLVRFTAAQSNCTWNVPAGVTSLGVLIVGGGGGAGFGSLGGGGGAGKVLTTINPISVNSGDTITLTIGDGGLGGYNKLPSTGGPWTFGNDGETTTLTINGSTYNAIGGGGGGGSVRSTGASGGSGGGGSTGSLGGSALTNNYSNFLSYGSSSTTHSGSGAGGGGAGGGNSNGSGGTGVTIYGLKVGGGGGGWPSSAGATEFGGGSAGGGTNASEGTGGSDHGTRGATGTGGGGGGGEKGGSGTVVFRYLAATVNTFSLAGGVTTATYRSPIAITTVVSLPSKVTFRAGNVIISGCKNKSATGSGSTYTATCSWKPSTRGKVAISATISPNESGASTPRATPINVVVSNRSGNRA